MQKKIINELATDIFSMLRSDTMSRAMASMLYDKGWRRQSAEAANVAPRAEVEKIFEEIEKIRAKEIRKCETFREKESDPSERKYWEGGYNSLRQLSYWIAELKKKYTEVQK